MERDSHPKSPSMTTTRQVEREHAERLRLSDSGTREVTPALTGTSDRRSDTRQDQTKHGGLGIPRLADAIPEQTIKGLQKLCWRAPDPTTQPEP